MSMQFRKAEKKRSKLRLGLFGVSKSGKTKSALRIATGIASVCGGRIAVIDSEGGSSELYANQFDFDILPLGVGQLGVLDYVEALDAAKKAGYSLVIVDSFSHAWYSLVEHVDKIAEQRYRGNSFRAWSEGSPIQSLLRQTIHHFPGHIICTMRTKTAWEIDESGGRKAPVRIGLAIEQGKNIEYEFTMLMEIDSNHVGRFIGDRSDKFQDKVFDKPDEILGRSMAEWLADGQDDSKDLAGMPDEEFQKKVEALTTFDITKLPAVAAKIRESEQYSPFQQYKLLSLIESRIDEGGVA